MAASAEVRNAIRDMIGRIRTPNAAADLASRFMQCLGDELAKTQTSAPAAHLRGTLEIAVRGGRGGPSGSEQRWLVEFWKPSQAEGVVAGAVHEGASAIASAAAASGDATPAKIIAGSYQDLMDIASRRRSPMAALASRRIQISGDVMQSMRTLGPAIARAAAALATQERQNPTPSQSSEMLAEAWVPNEASDVCMVCRRRWAFLVRHRHHCRQCGALICGNCSSVRNSLDGLRRCVNCADAGSLTASCISSASSTVSTAAPTRSTLLREAVHSMPTMHESPTGVVEGAADLGLLNAQIQQKIAPQLQEAIQAVPPTEREQRIWERLLASDSASDAKPVKGFGDYVWLLVGVLARGGACFLLLAWLTALEEDLPGLPFAVGHTLWGYAPNLCSQALILSWTIASGLMLFTVRAFFVFLVALPCAWRWLSTCGGVVSVFQAYALNGSLDCHAPWAARVFYSQSILATCCIVGLTLCLLVRRSLGRAASIYLTAAVPITLYWSAKRLAKILRLSEQTAHEWIYSPIDGFMGPYMANRFLALGGLFVKMGQWVSNASAFVPLTLQEHLKALVDDAGSDDAQYVRDTIQAQFGQSIEDMFEDFDLKPIASASIAQVHKATLKRGAGGKPQVVALKLQHKGIIPLMLSDLQALSRIVRFCCWLGGDTWKDAKKMFESWAKDMVKELDFANEVENLQEVRTGLQKLGVDVLVPKEVTGWTSKSVFAMDFCEGFRFTDRDRLALHGVDRVALGARALCAAASQLLEIGVFNSDPHAGNLLCQVRGTTAIPVLLDFGNCIRLSDKQRLAYCKLIVALTEASVTKVRDTLDEIGLISSQSGVHPERDLEYMFLVFRDTAPRGQTQQGTREFMKLRRDQEAADLEKMNVTTKAEKKKAKKQVQRYPMQMPDEFVLFMRMLYLVRGLCMQLDAKLPLLQIFEWHARRALAAAYPRPQRALGCLPEGGPASLAAPTATYEHVRRAVRSSLATICAERQGLGVQVCVRVAGPNGSSIVAVDECAGVLGSTDPRPTQRNTLMPLGDMAKLPALLLLLEAVRAGKTSYSAPLEPLLASAAGSTHGTPSLELRHALSHRSLARPGSSGPGEARSTLASTNGKVLVQEDAFRTVCSRIWSASSPFPLGEKEAAYLPLGPGYVAALACGIQTAADFRRRVAALPGLSCPIASELILGTPEAHVSAEVASPSSSLMSDMRTMMSAAAPALPGKTNSFLGTFAVQAADEKGNMKMKSGVASMLDFAGGLLVDPALGMAAAKASSGNPEKPTFSPDLGVLGSARAIAAVVDGIGPAADACGKFAEEPEKGEGVAGMMAALGLPRRAWDERGFEVHVQGSSPAAVVGMGSSNGLMGLAWQWSASASVAKTTVVILTNEVSIAGTPSRILEDVCAAMGLPLPASCSA